MSEPASTSAYTTRVAIAVILALLAVVATLLIWRLAPIWLLLFAATLFGATLRAISAWSSERTGMPEWLSVLLWVGLGVGLIGGFLWLVAASLVAQFTDLTERIPRALESLQAWASDYALLAPIAVEAEELLTGESESRASTYVESIVDISRVTLGTLANVLVTAILAIYVALDGRRYANAIVDLAPHGWRNTARELLASWGDALPWWIAARLASMSVIAILVSSGLLITGIPVPFILGLIAGLFSFVPFVGPIASVVPAALVAISESGGALLPVLGVFAIVQFLESYFITPLIERHSVSIPLFPLIAAQVVGAATLGIAGVMFATPLLLTLMVAIRVVYQKRILGEDVAASARATS